MVIGRSGAGALRAVIWIAVAAVVLVPSATGGASEVARARAIGEARLFEPTPARAEMLGWALDRYREAHLAVPAIDVHFHEDQTGCRGNVGYTEDSRVDLCVRLAMEAGPQRIVLHELAHVWTGAYLTDEARDAFTQMRGLDTWGDESAEWKDRGIEQAAEIIAWGLGDGSMMPMISGDRDPDALAEAFRTLTDTDPLHRLA